MISRGELYEKIEIKVSQCFLGGFEDMGGKIRDLVEYFQEDKIIKMGFFTSERFLKMNFGAIFKGGSHLVGN